MYLGTKPIETEALQHRLLITTSSTISNPPELPNPTVDVEQIMTVVKKIEDPR